MPRVSKEIWDAQPFGREFDIDIAIKLNVQARCVRYQRQKRGIPPKQQRRVLDLSGADWTKPTTVLAREFDCCPNSIVYWRQKLGVTEYQRLVPGANLPHKKPPDVNNAFAAKRAAALRAGGVPAKRAAMQAAAEYLVNWRTVLRRMARGAYAVDVTTWGGRKSA